MKIDSETLDFNELKKSVLPENIDYTNNFFLEDKIDELCKIIVKKNKQISEQGKELLGIFLKNKKEGGDYAIVPRDKYESLTRDSRVLAALHSGGVDNWDWYYDSIKEQYPEYFED